MLFGSAKKHPQGEFKITTQGKGLIEKGQQGDPKGKRAGQLEGKSTTSY